MAVEIAAGIRQETQLKVLRYVEAHGPASCRSIAFALYGTGKTGTTPRARVQVALAELEKQGELTREKGVGRRGADLVRAVKR